MAESTDRPTVTGVRFRFTTAREDTPVEGGEAAGSNHRTAPPATPALSPTSGAGEPAGDDT